LPAIESDRPTFVVDCKALVAPSLVAAEQEAIYQGGLVHAMLLRIQALLLPIKTLVLNGH
jgi:hypothetical protein